MGRNAVDAYNQTRQGYFSIEKSSGVREWAKRQFMFIMGITETNALQAHNNIISKNDTSKRMSKAIFCRKLARLLIHNSHVVLGADSGREEGATRHLR